MNLLDWVSRVDWADSILNWFNLLWTSNIYLSGLFYVVLTGVLLWGRVYTLNHTLPIFLTIAWMEGWDFLILNSSSECTNLLYSEINTLLTNNLNKYHPLLLYISSFSLLLILVQSNTLFSFPIRFYIPKNLMSYRATSYSNFGLSFTALFLGSWWALQEGTWGGWWNWDASEVLGLLVMTVSYISVHFQLNSYSFSRKYSLVTPSLTIVLLSYFFLQLNFELTSHSFGDRFTHFFNNNLFFFETILSLLILLKVLITHTFGEKSTLKSIVKPSYLTITQSPNSKVVIMVLTSFLVLLLLTFSFTPLFNYFLWRFFRVNSFNWPNYLRKLVFFLVFSLTLTFQNSGKLHLLIITFIGAIFGLDYTLLHLLAVLILLRNFYLIHWLTLTFLLTNIWSYSFQFAYWLNIVHCWNFFESGSPLYLQQTSFTCRNFFLDKVHLYTTSRLIRLPHFNFTYRSNAVGLNDFTLFTSCDTFMSVFYNNVMRSTTSIFIELPITGTLIEALFSIQILLYFSVGLGYWGSKVLI